MRFQAHNVTLGWQHHWDEQQRWRSSARASVERNMDNGAGYYDYWQYRLDGQLRYRPAGWELSARAAVAYFDFDKQPVSFNDPRTRHRTSVTTGARVERTLSLHWKLYAAYDYERSLSNLDVEQYEAHTGSGGVEYEF